jgi:polyisoprenyl-teichoic acid--peptidoglycan teichoic acid transferase
VNPRWRALIAAMLLLVVGSARLHRTRPAPTPAIELHRTAAASYYAPSRSMPLFVLILGSDVREGNPRTGRSDSIHLVAIDPVNGRGTIVGIPRDSWVPVPGLGTTKINASLGGGPERTVQTVSQLSGIPIQYWAIVDFSRFRKLVDTLGGVTVNVPYTMVDSFSGADFKPGPKKMNGAEALAFARDRHSVPRGDFDRSLNQGRLLVAGLQKFKGDTDNPLKLVKYFNVFGSLVASDVPVREMLNLARIASHVDPSKVQNLVAPGHGGSAGGASVVFLDSGLQEIFRKIRDDAVL